MRALLTAALLTLCAGVAPAQAQLPSMEVGSDAGAVHAADGTSSVDGADRAAGAVGAGPAEGEATGGPGGPGTTAAGSPGVPAATAAGGEPGGAAPAPAGSIASMLTPEQLRTANEAMFRLRSPVTAAHTVDMCPSVEALRDTIRVAAMTGMTTEAIVEDVVSRHGEHLRMLPKRRGAGLFAWVATPLVLLVGVGLILARVRRGAAPEVPAGGDVPLSEEDRARLEEEIRALEEAP